jgi:hypothetical protein
MTCLRSVTDLQGEPNGFLSLEILGGHNRSFRYFLFAIIKTEYHQWLLLSLFQMA